MAWRPGAFAVVLLLDGLVGAGLGLRQATWQASVEPSQVEAGLVSYDDPSNPFYLYQTRAATLLHPLGAAVLRAGGDERLLSRMLAALTGAIVFAAVGAWIWGFTRSPVVALAVPPLLIFIDLTGWGLNYPILFLGTAHDYGAIGLGLVLLALGLVGACETRAGVSAGGFVAGIAPAFHVVLGTFGLGTLAVATAFGRRDHSPAAVARGGLAGLAVTAAFFAWHRATSPPFVPIDPANAAAYLTAFLHHWGGHRQPLTMGAIQIALVITSVSAGAAVLAGAWATLSSSARFLAGVLVVAGVMGLAVAVLPTLLGEDAPPLLIRAMPARLLNLTVVAGFVSVLGLAWRERPSWPRVIVLPVILGAAVAVRAAGGEDVDLGLLQLGVAGGLAMVATAGATSRRAAALVLAATSIPLGAIVVCGFVTYEDGTAFRGAVTVLVLLALRAVLPGAWTERALSRPARACVLGVLAVMGTAAGVIIALRPSPAFVDRSNDPVLAEAARGRGLLTVACDMAYVQTITRRPLLVDPQQLDGLAYAIEAAPAAAAILEGVYGLRFFASETPDCRPLWEARTPREWAEIAARFRLNDILTPAGWRLSLPKVAENESYVLYRAVPLR